eukprot:Phypoly_transcript_07743.p1 GENE.Phypoly_transcript_07743~~Phypoly_transcript_07743.p1  ORF type:complete len:411 (+),score=38.53 Phypoly_transcript_07743:333-1565(+)
MESTVVLCILFACIFRPSLASGATFNPVIPPPEAVVRFNDYKYPGSKPFTNLWPIVGASDYTFTCTLYPTNIQLGMQHIWAKDQNSIFPNQLRLDVYPNGQLMFWAADPSGLVTNFSNPLVLTNGRKYYAAVTKLGNYFQIWAADDAQGMTNYAASSLNAPMPMSHANKEPFSLGGRYNTVENNPGDGYNFRGTITNANMFASALSKDDIINLWKSQSCSDITLTANFLYAYILMRNYDSQLMTYSSSSSFFWSSVNDNDFTLMAQFMLYKLNTANSIFSKDIDFSSDFPAGAIELTVLSNQLYFIWNGVTISSLPIRPMTVYDVAVVNSQGTITLYVKPETSSSIVATIRPATENANTTIGTTPWMVGSKGGYYPFHGFIQNARIFDVALSQKQISSFWRIHQCNPLGS